MRSTAPPSRSQAAPHSGSPATRSSATSTIAATAAAGALQHRRHHARRRPALRRARSRSAWAAGFARDDSKIGSSGTRNRTRGASIAGYGSFQAGPRTFIDALVGYGKIDFDIRSPRERARTSSRTAERKGRQVFGSIAAAYEWRRDNLLLSPYGRFDFSRDRLDAVTESGVGNYALAYDVAGPARHPGRARRARRVEARDRVRLRACRAPASNTGASSAATARASLSYADLVGGPEYTRQRPTGTSRNALLLGVGADFIFRGGLQARLRLHRPARLRPANVQGVRIMVTQDLDAPWRRSRTSSRLTFRSRSTSTSRLQLRRQREPRARAGREALGQHLQHVGQREPQLCRSAPTCASQATALVSGEKFDRYNGLGRFSGGAQARAAVPRVRCLRRDDLRPRRARALRAVRVEPTAPARATSSASTRGARSPTASRSSASSGGNVRHGNSEVFNWQRLRREGSTSTTSLGRKGTLYVAGEFRRGDTVRLGPALARQRWASPTSSWSTTRSRARLLSPTASTRRP